MFCRISHSTSHTLGRQTGGIRTLIAVGLFLACAGGCASTRLEPLTSQTQPSLLDEDERALWASADKIEGQIAACLKPTAGCEQAEKYLGEIAQRLTPDFSNPHVQVRIRVLPDPNPNAFILPNGAMYVNSGLLALLENEAQIATVLGHEFAHFRNRHSYRERIKEHNELVKGVLIGSTLGVLAGAPDAAGSMAEVWRISSISGYSRNLESEADHESLLLMLQAGYQPEQAIKAFEQLQTVADEKQEENQRFATHPKLSERIDSYRKCLEDPVIRQQAAGERVADDIYNSTLFDVVLENAELSLNKNHYVLAQANIDRCLRLKPDCARAHYLRGEFLRSAPIQEENPWQRAVECYERALRCDPNCADARREIGLMHRQLGNRDRAGESLRKYVEQAGSAPDVPLVKSYMERLADPNAGSAPPYRAPQVTQKDLRAKAKTVGIMPVLIPDGIIEPDKKSEELESALTEKLKQAGFTVVPSSAYTAIHESTKKSVGALYDPNTGAVLEDRHGVVREYAFREYVSIHRIDALAFPAVAVFAANWNMNLAMWHGAQEATTGKEGFWANLAASSAYGTIPALSFRIIIINVYGEPCYQGFGGIQLASHLAGQTFVSVPAHELLTNSAKNARGVEIACQSLLNETE